MIRFGVGWINYENESEEKHWMIIEKEMYNYQTHFGLRRKLLGWNLKKYSHDETLTSACFTHGWWISTIGKASVVLQSTHDMGSKPVDSFSDVLLHFIFWPQI